MNFCSRCGHPFEPPGVADGAQSRQACSHCGDVFYHGPRLIVAMFGYRDDQLLMQKRRENPGMNQWTVPSGFMEMNETPEQAVIRETFEETGVVVDPDHLHPYLTVGFATINEVHLVYRVQLGPDVRPVAGAESLEVAFLKQSEIQSRPLAFRETVGDYTSFFFEHLAQNRFPFMSVHVTGSRSQPALESRAYALEAGKIEVFEGKLRRRKV